MCDRSAVQRRLNRITLVLAWITLAGCAGYVSPNPHSVTLVVDPASAVVAAGSVTKFTVTYMPSQPEGGSLTWTVVPATGGTVTSDGVYTASGTPGQYTVVATWTAKDLAKNGTFNNSASVQILPLPQSSAVLNPDLVEASSAEQTGGAIQNGVVIGQPFPFVVSADSNGNIEVQSGFTPPVECIGSDSDCNQ
jgi:hypothetical protein